ncbi:MAG: PAAR-like protein [Bacillota bacterium]
MIRRKRPALNQTSKLMCVWGGEIQIIDPGQRTIQTT